MRNGASSSQPEEVPTWGTSKHLSEVRPSWQPILYKTKIFNNKNPFCYERLVDASDWEKYGVFEPFRKWGWMAALKPINYKLYKQNQILEVYPDAVLEWISTLVKEDGNQPPFTTTLTGTVSGYPVSLSMNTFRQLAGDSNDFDSGVTTPNVNYSYPSAFSLFENGPNTEQWFPMLRTLFKIEGDEKHYKLMREDLMPLARVLSVILTFNILPRKSDQAAMRKYEVLLLHALVTGTPALSLRHIMMMNIWESRDVRERSAAVPYVRFLSAFLFEAGAIPRRMKPRLEPIKPVKTNIKGLYLSNKDQTYLIRDLPKGLTFSYNGGVGSSAAADGTESSEEEQMDTDQGRRPGKGAQHDMSAPDHEWGRTQFKQQFWSHLDNQFNMLRDALKAQFWMQEYYRQQDYEQAERVRHYHDLIADRPPVPKYTPIDYSLLQRPSEVGPQSFVPPPYPGIPPPMFYRSPPPRAGDEGGSSQGGTTSPWDMAPLAQGFYESLFSYPPSGPQ